MAKDPIYHFKARKHSTPRPTVKFYDVKSKIFSKTLPKGSKLPDDDEDDAGDSWLDEEPELYSAVRVLDADTSSPINPASKYLATFLANEEEQSTAEVSSEEIKDKKVQAVQGATGVQDDNDFSMDFD